MSKQHCRMQQVKRFFRQCRILLREIRTLLRQILPVASTLLLVWMGPNIVTQRTMIISHNERLPPEVSAGPEMFWAHDITYLFQIGK